jgi:hypothetical protein
MRSCLEQRQAVAASDWIAGPVVTGDPQNTRGASGAIALLMVATREAFKPQKAHEESGYVIEPRCTEWGHEGLLEQRAHLAGWHWPGPYLGEGVTAMENWCIPRSNARSRLPCEERAMQRARIWTGRGSGDRRLDRARM